jgi:acyl-CoA synthetase (AMP-forming)/AMP-acid ligase II
VGRDPRAGPAAGVGAAGPRPGARRPRRLPGAELGAAADRALRGADGRRAAASAAEIVDHVRGRIAHFKAPKHVWFGELPKTSTGTIQKYVLREREWGPGEMRIH